MIRPLLFILALLLPLPAASLTLDGATTWRGELQFREMVKVPVGAVLTVEPGAVIRFDSGGLEVSGRLQANGARFSGVNWQGIVLKGTAADTLLSDCVVDGADTGIEVIGGSPLLQRLHLRGNRIGLQLGKKTTAQVSGCRIENNQRAGLIIKDEARPRVEQNQIEGNGLFGAYIVHARPGTFSGNSLKGQPTGLKISNFGSDPQITGNRFEQNGVGILVDKAARPTLEGNRLKNNGTGLHLYRRADPEVLGNRFDKNGIGILVEFSSYPRISGNDFAGNDLALKLAFQSSRWEVQNGEAARKNEASRGAFGQAPKQDFAQRDRRPAQLTGTVDARNNWWGEAGTEEMARESGRENPSFIHDGRDQPSFNEGGFDYPLDQVLYLPWSPSPLTGETIR